MPNQTTQLSSGLINGNDRLTIELVEPPNLPAAILLRWPQSSITTPDAYSNVAAAAMQILAAAVTELAALRVGSGYEVTIEESLTPDGET
jgi:hypothetical protein